MKTITVEEAICILERRGWKVDEYPAGSNSLYFSWFSPAGEDFGFDAQRKCRTFEDVLGEFESYYNYFDVDDHVDLWAPGRGTRGIPDSYSVLVHDAEAIEKELCDCAKELRRELLRQRTEVAK